MSAVIEPVEILVDEWVGCYSGGWKGVIVDAAFAHPAKVAFNLARRIYEHAVEEQWIASGDCVVDPFGGIGGCAFHGIVNGMRVVTCELEQKFVDLAKENRELWRAKFTGLPGFDADNWTILQGDSRKLASVIREAGIAVSSPPYAAVSPEKSSRSVDYAKQYETYRSQGGGASFEKFVATQELHSHGYGSSAGQLARLPEGDIGLVVSSPPFSQPETRDRAPVQQGSISDAMTRAYTVDRQSQTDGNLAAMPLTDFAAAISSPPYNLPFSQDHNGSRGGKRSNGTAPSSEPGAFIVYGSTPGQIEGLSGEGFQAAISSPPYEADVMKQSRPADVQDDRAFSSKFSRSDLAGRFYSQDDDNLGNSKGDTFWSASRTILEQLYSVLTPGAHAIFIVKAFVRNKQIVDFPGQWAQLCEAVGFNLIHDHHAMLTEHSGTQGGMFGEDKEIKVKRVSFFRRLHEKRAPETEIFYENVLCFERREQ